MDAVSPTLINLIIFVLAIYVGYHVVWTVTPALHTPLMAVTNAISAIVIVGAMLAAALTETTLGKTMGVLAVALAAVNVFGGFLVTRRMLEMSRDVGDVGHDRLAARAIWSVLPDLQRYEGLRPHQLSASGVSAARRGALDVTFCPVLSHFAHVNRVPFRLKDQWPLSIAL